MQSDPIANMITTLKNGYAQAKPNIRVPFSNLKLSVCQILKYQKFIKDYQKDKTARFIDIQLLYQNAIPALTDIKQISKPSRRVYQKAKQIVKSKSRRSLIIISSAQGLVTQETAKKKNVGGEIICEVS